jgi:hypothetical protein
VTDSTVAPAGAGGALADDDAAADDAGAADGDGVAACGGAAAQCTSTRPAASISARTAHGRLKAVNRDESSPLASISPRPLRKTVSLDQSGANATADGIRCSGPGELINFLNRSAAASRNTFPSPTTAFSK